MKLMYLLVGKSGSGKTTIANEMEKWGYRQLESYTTREPRYEGEDGHIFVTEKDYHQHKGNNEIVAYTFFNSRHYWCTRTQLYQNDVYVIDPDGVKYLKQHVDDIRFIIIHIHTPLYRRIWRMFRRGDGIGAIIRRLRNDKEKFKSIGYDYRIKNTDLDITLLEIRALTRLYDWINDNADKFKTLDDVFG